MAKPARVKKKQSQTGAARKAEKAGDAKAPDKSKVKEAKKAALDQARAQKPRAREAKAAKAAAEPKGIRGRMARTPAKPAAKAAAGKEKRSAVKFLREVKVELSKVTWPSREELIQSTIVVLIAVAIAGVYIAIFDALFSRLIGFLS
jgi:preprotein translocase subunit SecE